MLFVSILTSDRARDAELWAVIWRGRAPESLKLHGVYNLAGNKRLFLWEGGSDDDLQFMDRFNYVGLLETYPAFDRTEGWQYAFSGDLSGWREMIEKTGAPAAGVAAAMDLRTRGHQAPTTEAALAEGREWTAQQSQLKPRRAAGATSSSAP